MNKHQKVSCLNLEKTSTQPFSSWSPPKLIYSLIWIVSRTKLQLRVMIVQIVCQSNSLWRVNSDFVTLNCEFQSCGGNGLPHIDSVFHLCVYFCGFSMTPAIQFSYTTSTEPDQAGAHVPVMWSIWLGWKEKGTETGTESGSLIALTAGNEPLNEVRGNFATTTRGRCKACCVRPITAFNQMG